MFRALDFYPWRVFSPEDSLRLGLFCIYKPPPGARAPRWVPELSPGTVGPARHVTSNSCLRTSGPPAVIRVSFIPSCLEVTYLLHLPFPITAESLHWLRALPVPLRPVPMTNRAGWNAPDKGQRCCEDTRLPLPRGSHGRNVYPFIFPGLGKAARLPVNSRSSSTSLEVF